MSHRLSASMAALGAAVAAVSLASVPVAGQVATATAGAWTLPRTPDGQPDLQGFWSFATITPLERPDEFAGRECLTEEKVAALDRQAQTRTEEQAAEEAAKKREQATATGVVDRDLKERFAGTWRLVGIERLGPNGEVLPPPAPPAFGSVNPVGFLIYDRAGHMGVTIMQGGRQKYAGAQPTPDEARGALASYTAYFGTFTVDAAEGVVRHHVQGSLNPSMAAEQKRFFEYSGNRLTLKPPRGAMGTQSRLMWERVPDLPNLSPVHRRFMGFWKLLSNERRNRSGELVSSNPGQTGVIIYTASGHMAVHLMQPGRSKFAAASPTPEEALAALRTYSSYFGPYTIHEADRFVVHHRIGLINPGQVGTDAQRFYEFAGDRLILKPPPATVDGQPVQGVITWERLSDGSR